MVATVDEGKKIIQILLTYLPIDASVEMLDEMWEEIGLNTNNESLQDTILMIKKFLEAKWEYSLPTQSDTLFQGQEY